MAWKLVDTKGNEVTFPYEATNFRGEKKTLIDGQPPQHSRSTGKVWADPYGQTWFPSVYGVEWVHAY